MGRRKIEIQPITHERNRSVTFLKRKNGLFKKAYELGVLCSVDVTVIIFEKAGTHNEKLYEYCSTNDSDAQVSKRLDWDGDRDTRGPADFGGEKHQHPGLLVPSSGHDYDDDDGDGDGDGDSTEEVKDPKRKKTQTAKDRRSSDEMSSAPRHSLSHPSLPTPISTYLPTATLPVSDQRGSPHTSTPPSAHGQPPKRARRESSGYPLPTPILPNPPLPASLLAHPHSPPYYNQENAAAYRSLFGDMPSGPGGGGAAQYQYAQHPAYRRPGTVHLSGGAGGYASPGPGSGGAYHAPQYAHSHATMFPGANPFASLLAASGAGGGGGASGGPPGTGPGGGTGGFDLEWPVHAAGAPPQPQPPQPRSPPRAQTPEPAPQQNGAARTKGGAGPGGEDAEDATSWLDYLAGIPARRDPPARDMEVDSGPPAPAPAPAAEEQRSSSSEQSTPRKRKHEG